MRTDISSGATQWRSGYGLTVALILALGVVFRAVHFVGGRPLWTDEAMLAANLADRSLFDLFGTLADGQAAPIGFLLLSKLSIQVFGFNEWALRLLPFLGSLALLPVLFHLARALGGPVVAALALAVAAASEPLVYYAAECKPYGLDALVAVLIYGAALRCLARPGPAGLTLLAVVGALGLTLSYASLFVLGAVGLALLGHEVRARAWTRTTLLVGVGLLWLAVLAAVLVAGGFSGEAAVDDMRRFWTNHFAPFPPAGVADLQWYLQALFELGHPWREAGGLALALAAIGAAVLWRQRPVWTVMLCGPLLLAGIASALRLYPFTERFLVFSIGAMSILLALAVVFLVERLPRLRPAVAAILIAVLLLPPLARIVGRSVASPPFAFENVRAMVPVLQREMRPEDQIYVYFGALPAYDIYGLRGPLAGRRAIAGRAGESSWQYLVRDAVALSGTGRTWVVMAHQTARKRDDERLLTYFFDQVGRRLEKRQFGDASLYLYDFDGDTVPAIRLEPVEPPPDPLIHPGFRPRAGMIVAD